MKEDFFTVNELADHFRVNPDDLPEIGRYLLIRWQGLEDREERYYMAQAIIFYLKEILYISLALSSYHPSVFISL